MGNDVNCEENFRIIYYDMGQGDCILIVCPNKQLVMIDCGSSKHKFDDEEKIIFDIRDRARENKGALDALILTHPDKDHYNQVSELLLECTFTDDNPKKGKKRKLRPYNRLKIANVYYSEEDPSKYIKFPMSSYFQGGIGSHIIRKDFETETINRVIINNKEDPHILTYTKGNGFILNGGQKSKIDNHRYKVLEGTIKAGKEWSISIIAGHVQVRRKGDNGKPPKKKQKISAESAKVRNTISLVTLLEIDGHKALFTGDATDDTEDFLLSEHDELISEIDFVHVPHHGSESSSTEDFVKATQPKGVQVTMANAETSYHLPKEAPIKRWVNVVKTPAKPTSHFYDYWVKATRDDGNEKLDEWKNNESYKDHINDIERGHSLQIDKIEENTDEDFTGCYLLKYQAFHCYMLYRKQTDKDLWETGATATKEGFNDWLLPCDFKEHMEE